MSTCRGAVSTVATALLTLIHATFGVTPNVAHAQTNQTQTDDPLQLLSSPDLMSPIAFLKQNSYEGEDFATELITLDGAMAHAMTHNHKILNLIDQVSMSDLDYESARSVYRMQFGSSLSSNARVGAEVGSAYSTYMSKENESGSRYAVGLYNSTFGDQSLSEWRFSYTLPFFRNPLDDNKLRIIQAEMGAARNQRLLDIGREELSNQVVSAYLKLAMATKARAIAEGDQKVAESIYRALEIREANGELSKLELSEARLRVLQARQGLDMALIDLEAQRDAFRLLVGLDQYRPFAIDTEVLATVDTSLLERPMEELELNAITQRTELVAKQEELTMANHRIASTRLGRLPPMEVSLNYSLLGEGDSPVGSFQFDDQRFGVGVRMNTDIANSEHKIKQRKLQLRKQSQQREYDYLQSTITAEVRSAYGAALRARTSMEYSEEFVKIAELQHKQNTILLERGELTDLEMLESEQALSKARQRALGARVGYLLAEQRLAVASGVRRLL